MAMVTAKNYPRIYEALEAIQADVGFASAARYSIPRNWAAQADQIEQGLCSLSVEDRSTFVLGLLEEQEAIGMRSDDLRVAFLFLDAFFDDFDDFR